MGYGFTPREYQRDVLEEIGKGCRRSFLVWHRQSGKDFLGFNIINDQALIRPGTYLYMFPTYRQAKEVIWDGFDYEGNKYLDYLGLPDLPLRDECKFSETELQITLPPVNGAKHGSIIQLAGTDKIDLLRGMRPVGVILSEFAYHNPLAWKTIEAPLLANDGFAIFITTPNGANHAKTLWDATAHEDGWFNQLLTIDNTFDGNGKPIIPHERIEALRRQGTSEDFIQQEYYCSFTGAMQGSYYSELVRMAELDGRITRVPVDPTLPVHTVWDIGRDTTAIGFKQEIGNEVRWVDYYENKNKGPSFYASILSEKARQNNWQYGWHLLPHDAKSGHMASEGKSTQQQLHALGVRPTYPVKKLNKEPGIDLVRDRFHKYWFDATKCARLVQALIEYKREYDSEKEVYKPTPVHNWASHPADMVRYEAVGAQDGIINDDMYDNLPKVVLQDYNPFDRRSRAGWQEAEGRGETEGLSSRPVGRTLGTFPLMRGLRDRVD